MQYKAKFAVCSQICTETHKCIAISMQNFLILNMVVHKVTARL